MSSCQAGGLAGPRGFNRISNPILSLTTVFHISCCPLVPSHTGPGPGSRVRVKSWRGAALGRGLSVGWAMTGCVLMEDHECWGTGTCLCR